MGRVVLCFRAFDIDKRASDKLKSETDANNIVSEC